MHIQASQISLNSVRQKRKEPSKSTYVSSVLLPLCFLSVQLAVLDNTRINPADIGDIVVGTVLGPGSQRANECRMVALFAGFPGN
jgi:hypothetical protein